MISVLAVGRNTYSAKLDLCLTARALGAAEITFVGKSGSRLIKYMNNINKRWGGSFKIHFAKNYNEIIRPDSKYKKIYLTRYGTPLQGKSYMLRTYKNLLLIVTAADLVKPIHGLSDFNISVSSQPHCSAAAVAVFLHEFYSGRELAMHFENARYKLVRNDSDLFVEKPK